MTSAIRASEEGLHSNVPEEETQSQLVLTGRQHRHCPPELKIMGCQETPCRTKGTHSNPLPVSPPSGSTFLTRVREYLPKLVIQKELTPWGGGGKEGGREG